MPRKKPISIEDTGEKPVVYITGQEETGFDFWPALRASLRPLHRYALCRKVEKEIVDPAIWRNKGLVTNVLNKYVILTIKPADTKKKKTRANRPPLTEEQKQALRERLVKARAMKGKKEAS